jgi:hypothetical protein
VWGLGAASVAIRVADRFDEAGIEYAIGGALALGVWGAPRSTQDVDISVYVDLAGLDGVVDALERAGVMVPRDAARDAERMGFFRGMYGRTPVDVFLALHPFHADARARRRAVDDPDGVPRWFLSPEDFFVLKIYYGRDKDEVDLRRFLSVRADLDFAYVEGWLAKMVPSGDPRLEMLARLRARA